MISYNQENLFHRDSFLQRNYEILKFSPLPARNILNFDWFLHLNNYKCDWLHLLNLLFWKL